MLISSSRISRFAFAVLFATGCGTAIGQTPVLVQDSSERMIVVPDDTARKPAEIPLGQVPWVGRGGIRQELFEADRLTSQGRFQEVIEFLLPIWNKELKATPDEAIGSALKRSYRSLKDYEGLRALIRQEMAFNPENPIKQAELAETFFSTGMADSAEAVFRQMIAGGPSEPERHNLVAQTYMRAGRSNEALDAYRESRRSLKDSTVFAEEMARLYEARREYASAIDEYFRWLNARPESQRAVQRLITNLIKLPEAGSQIGEALQRILRAYPKHEYAHRLYGDILFESGHFDSAFAEYRRADQYAPQPGQHRLFGIERALETNQHAIARDQAASFIKDYPVHSDLIRAHLALARAELSLGHAEVAVNMLKSLAGQFPSDPERLRLYYEIGEVYRRHTPMKDSGRVYFDAIVNHPKRVPERTGAWLRIGEIEIFRGDLVGADSAFNRASESVIPTLREEVAFRQAELLFLKDEYETCAARLKDFITQFPRGLYVNDAIVLIATIKDSPDTTNGSLKQYAHGVLALRRDMRDSALFAFEQLAKDTTSPLADDAQLALGDVYASSGDYLGAIDVYRSLVASFPESFLVPRAWARIGHVYADSLNDPTQARLAFQTILSDYKSSPIVEEARRRLQNLPVP